jgi:hypothetical protein
MLIEVLETTGHMFEGMRFPLPEKGSKLVLGEYDWDVIDVIDQGNGIYTLVDPNFIALVKEVKE